jgi:DNA-binding winged helix-turn-helix (wHTH) protein
MHEPVRPSLGDFVLGDWVVQPLLRRITDGDQVNRLEPRCMDLLVYLARYPGVVHTRQRLVEEVWRVQAVAENTLTHAIAEIRRALGDDARNPRYIETIYRTGYRLLIRPGPSGGDDQPDDRSSFAVPPGRELSARARRASVFQGPGSPVVRRVDDTAAGDLRFVIDPCLGETPPGFRPSSRPTELVVRICIEMPEDQESTAECENPSCYSWREKIS